MSTYFLIENYSQHTFTFDREIAPGELARYSAAEIAPIARSVATAMGTTVHQVSGGFADMHTGRYVMLSTIELRAWSVTGDGAPRALLALELEGAVAAALAEGSP